MKTLVKLNCAKIIFIGGCKEQLKQEWVIGTAAGMGLAQGLKYNGSIKRGLAGATAVLVVCCAANGFYNLAINWDKIKEVTKEE